MTKPPTDAEITASLDRYRRWAMHSTSACGDDLAAANILRAALASAENRGFREAADWLDENRYQDSPFYADALRAEADRREGKA